MSGQRHNTDAEGKSTKVRRQKCFVRAEEFREERGRFGEEKSASKRHSDTFGSRSERSAGKSERKYFKEGGD